MTPFGHIGGGLLIASITEKIILNEQFSTTTLGIAVFLSLLPDMDGIPAYLFRKWRPGYKRLDHHGYVTHTPIFYIFLSMIVWIAIGKEFSILFLLLTLTHLLLDSWGTDDGIMWLWPMSKQKFSFFPTNLHAGGIYGVQYYLQYVRHLRVLLPEIILFVGGLVSVFIWW